MTDIKERPILMKGPLVAATLEDRKKQTRRIIKLPCQSGPNAQGNNWTISVGSDGAAWPEYHMAGWPEYRPMPCPYGKVGDRLWVRETFTYGYTPDYVGFKDGGQKYKSGVYEPALSSYAPGAFVGIKWKPSIHMPRWASRLTLEITGIRIERVHDITEADAIAEGVEPLFSPAQVADRPDLFIDPMPYKNYLWHGTPGLTAKQIDEWYWQYSSYETAKLSFSSLWHSINAGRGFGWDVNPWVWVIEYKQLETQ